MCNDKQIQQKFAFFKSIMIKKQTFEAWVKNTDTGKMFVGSVVIVIFFSLFLAFLNSIT